MNNSEGQTQEPVGGMKPKSVKERDNLDLLSLVCELSGRASMYPSKEMHDAFWEARKELESRLTPPPAPVGIDVAQLFDNNFDCYTCRFENDGSMNDNIPAMSKEKFIELFKAGYSASLPQSSTEEEKELTTAYLPCHEYDEEATGTFTTMDGTGMCHVKEIKVETTYKISKR